MKINPGVILSYNDTKLILMGQRESLYIEETIGISNRFSAYNEVDLRECGVRDGVRNIESFNKVIHKVLGYLNYNKMIDKRVYDDVRIIISNNYTEKATACIEEHNKLLHEDYDDIPGIVLSPSRDRVVLTIPSHTDAIIKIVFMFKGRQYHVITNISEPQGKTVTATRWRKMVSGYSLLNELSDWSNDISVSADNSRLVKTYLPDIREYFLCDKNVTPLKLLIKHINEHSKNGVKK